MISSTDILTWYKGLHIDAALPAGIRVLNPYRDASADVWRAIEAFYSTYYPPVERSLILGINPGRLGAGATGIPFTDPHRLQQACGITKPGVTSHEPSSVFVYKVIAAWGGVEAFYRDFFIGAVSPLGLVQTNARGNEVNCNYYDAPTIQEAMTPFIQENLRWQAQHTHSHRVLLYGAGQNLKAFTKLQEGLFNEVKAVEHPRYIMQYKAKSMDEYINKHLQALTWLNGG